MSTKTQSGIPEFIESLINTQWNLTVVTNNWFSNFPPSNHLLPYETFVFYSDGERRNCLLILCVGDHNHALCFKPITVLIIP